MRALLVTAADVVAAHQETLLLQKARSGSLGARVALATQNVPESVFDVLAKSRSRAVRELLAANPQAPDRILDKLAARTGPGWDRAAAAARAELLRRQAARRTEAEADARLDKALDDQLLERVLDDVARRQPLSDDDQARFTGPVTPTLIDALLDHAGSTVTLIHLLESPAITPAQARRILAGLPTVSTHSGHPPAYHMGVYFHADNPSADPAWLAERAVDCVSNRDWQGEIAARIARNPNTPGAGLGALLGARLHPRYLLAHPNTPADALTEYTDYLLADANRAAWQLDALACHPNTPAEALRQIYPGLLHEHGRYRFLSVHCRTAEQAQVALDLLPQWTGNAADLLDVSASVSKTPAA